MSLHRRTDTGEVRDLDPAYLATLPEAKRALWAPYTPPEPDPAPVPEEVALWRIKAVADLAGLTPAIEAGIEAMTEPQRTIARRAWFEGNVIVRNSPLVLGLAAELGLTPAQIDDLFLQAESLPA